MTGLADSKNVPKRTETHLRKQKRGLLTRQELLRSARTIFARDGFEHARLEDIAAKAGKTRGAFYDNFKDKEDVFCAIFEENVDRDVAELTPLLEALPTIEQRIERLGNFLCELSKDRERILLNLEFKLYAIRHPRKRKRLADLHGVMRLRSSVPELNRLLPQLLGKKKADAPSVDLLALGGILDGLALCHLFDPDTVNDLEFARYMKLCLRESFKPFLSKRPGKSK